MIAKLMMYGMSLCVCVVSSFAYRYLGVTRQVFARSTFCIEDPGARSNGDQCL